MSFIKTGTGRVIDFLNPDVSQITLNDIVIAQGRNSRFGGHSPLRLGQHIIEVAHLMMMVSAEQGDDDKTVCEAGLVGIFHDLPESYCLDVMTPLKRLLAPLYDPIEARILAAILERFQFTDIYPKYEDLLKWADRQAVQEEALRFDLDGKFLDPYTGEFEDIPFVWVNPDIPRYLRHQAWDDSFDISWQVTNLFFLLMCGAGLGHVLTNEVIGWPVANIDTGRVDLISPVLLENHEAVVRRAA